MISTTNGDAFQDFCDRLCLRIYPNDYNPIRAGGKTGDLKNDGYCPKARTFFQASGTRNLSEMNVIKKKIREDLKGCIAEHSDVKKWVFLTNQTLPAEIDKCVDELRKIYKNVTIEVWGHLVIADKVASLSPEIISEIIDRNIHNVASLADEQEVTIIDEIFEDILKKIKKQKGNYSYTNSINLEDKIKLNFKDESDQEQLREYFKYALLKLSLINERMSSENTENQNDIHSFLLSRYHHLKKECASNIDLLNKLFDEVTPLAKRLDPNYHSLGKAFILFFFEDCTIFEKTEAEKIC